MAGTVRGYAVAVTAVAAVVLATLLAAGWLRTAPPPAPTGSGWYRVLADLDRARGLALARADPGPLRLVYAPGSPAGAADAATVAALVRAGAMARGVRHETVRLWVLSATRARARLVVTQRMVAYRVVAPGGVRTVAARGPRTFGLDLVAVGGAWRIRTISAARAPTAGPVRAPGD